MAVQATDERFKKLPVWARELIGNQQREITSLTADVVMCSRLRDRTTSAAPDALLVGEYSRWLEFPSSDIVRFQTGQHTYFEIRRTDNPIQGLRIGGTRQLTVLPVASNVILIGEQHL